MRIRTLTRVVLVPAALVAASVAAGVAVSAAESESPHPNVLFLLSDDQRADTIGALGNEHIRTPNLDRLVRQGTSFSRAVCANPICTPSRAEILTGCSGFTNGVIDFGARIDESLVLWPAAMRDAGYRTWYVGKWHNDGKPIERGFDRSRGLFAPGGGKWWREQLDWKGTPVTGYRGWVFQDDRGNLFPDRGVGLTPRTSSQIADAAIELLQESNDEPFFLQVSFTAPHDPLWPPPGSEPVESARHVPLPPNYYNQHPFDHGNLTGRDERLLPLPRSPEIVRRTIAMYYRVIADMDQQIGRILAALEESGQADRTVIVFASDHGLAVGSHGLRGKQNMYEHTINVPLVVTGPRVAKQGSLQHQVYLRDLFPTVCELIGVEVPATVEGRSFARLLAGPAAPIHSHVFCYFRDLQRMVRDERWKLIHYPRSGRYQLFDLSTDPYELRDLAGESSTLSTETRLRSLLRNSQREAGDPLYRG